MTNTAAAWLKSSLFVAFTISGFSGLIYESIWSHYLKLMLGHAAYAQTLVLAIFMGGMAIGAWLASRYSKNWSNLLLAYAVIEGIIGIFALVFHSVFTTVLDIIYLTWIPSLEHPIIINGLKWTVGSCLILPQSILLGMTFPLMSAGIIRLYPQTTGASLGMLYFTNSIGAAVGVLVSGFVLIQQVGLPGTILTAGILNVLLAIAVWGLAKGRDGGFPLAADPSREASISRFVGLLLLVASLSSAASFFYEIGWIRMLSLVLGSTTQAFELMLSAFITGLAFGGLWIRRRIDQITTPLRFAGYVQIAMGLFALLTLPLYNSTFDIMAFMIHSLSKNEGGYTLFTLGSHVIALAIMLPATFMAGMTLPLFTYALIKHGDGERSIGRVYAANTIGAILGVLLAVHGVMPTLGLKGLITLGAFLDMAIGIGLLAAYLGHLRRWEFPASVSTAMLALLIITFGVHFDPLKMASGVYRNGVSTLQNAEVVYHQDGKTATIDLVRLHDNVLTITTNGKPDAAVAIKGPAQADEITMIEAATIPLALHPQAKTVANIGLGSGMTTHALLGANTLERVDTVEIESAVIEAARGFGKFVERAYTDPRSHIYVEDAKTFFSSHNSRYDIIVSEPSNPWVSGVASLFSDEFYQRITGHLNDDGLLVQWLQLYETNLDLLASVFKALSKHFANYAVFNTDNANILIVATNGRDLNHLDDWIFKQDRLNQDLVRVNIKGIQDLEIRRIGNKALLQSLFASYGVPANSDYFPYLSYNASKSRYLQENAVGLTYLHLAPIPVLSMLDRRVFKDEPPVSVSAYFSPTTAQQQARQILGQLLSQPAIENNQIPYEIRYYLNAVELGLSTCSLQKPDEELLRIGLFSLAANTNPYLDPQELSSLWEYLTSRPCYAGLSAVTKAWFDLHRAISERNPAEIVKTSTVIIQNTSVAELSQSEWEYLVTANLTASLLQEGTQNTQPLPAIFNQLRPLGNPPLFLQLVLSLLAG